MTTTEPSADKAHDSDRDATTCDECGKSADGRFGLLDVADDEWNDYRALCDECLPAVGGPGETPAEHATEHTIGTPSARNTTTDDGDADDEADGPEIVTDGGQLVKSPSASDDADDTDDDRACHDGNPVDAIWLESPEPPTTPIVAHVAADGFAPGWLHFRELDGTERSVPSHRVTNVRLSVSEDYLEDVR